MRVPSWPAVNLPTAWTRTIGTAIVADQRLAHAGWPDHPSGTRFAAQALIEVVSVPAQGEHFRRRPVRHVQALGFTIEGHDRFTLGIVERLAARKPQHTDQLAAGDR